MRHLGTTMHLVRPEEMFLSFDVRKVAQTPKALLLKYGCREKRVLIRKVWSYALTLVIDDVIGRGVQFMFPGKKDVTACIRLRRFTGKEYTARRRNGGFKDFDPLETDFNGYCVYFTWTNASGDTFEREFHLNRGRKERIAELARAGKIRVGGVTDMGDYMESVCERFSDLPKEDLRYIVRYGFNTMRTHICRGSDIMVANHDLYLQSGKIYFSDHRMLMYVIRRMANKAKMMYKKLTIPWDGYVYFTVSLDNWLRLRDRVLAGELVDFGHRMVYRYRDVGFLRMYPAHVFLRAYLPGLALRSDKCMRLVTDNAELLEIVGEWTYDTIRYGMRTYESLRPKNTQLQRMYDRNRKKYRRIRKGAVLFKDKMLNRKND